MPVLAKITDQNDRLFNKWVHIVRKDRLQSRIMPMDGSSASSILVPTAILGTTYNTSTQNFVHPAGNLFAKFPVKLFGPGSADGNYLISSVTDDPVEIKAPTTPGLPGPQNTPIPTPNPTPQKNKGGLRSQQNQRNQTGGTTPSGGSNGSGTAPQSPTISVDTLKGDGPPVVTVDQIAHFLAALPIEQSAMIWGPAGVGKSQGVQTFALDFGLKLYDVRLPLLNPEDIRGVGVPDLVRKLCVWLPPEFLPREENSLLFLDEITAAVPSMQALAYQLTLDRRVGEYTLPAGCRVVCAGNRETDRGVAYRMPSPLANRLFHMEVKPDINSWRTWAFRENIDPRVISYLTVHPASLHSMTADNSGQAWPSPRSWVFASRILQQAGLTPRHQGIGVAGCIGSKEAKLFVKHCNSYQAYADMTMKFIRGEIQPYMERQPETAQVLAVAMVANLGTEIKEIDRVVKWAAVQEGECRKLTIRSLEEKYGDEMKNVPAYANNKMITQGLDDNRFDKNGGRK